MVLAVTMKDVAKAAGVSASTVSRVISDSPQISDATKEKVYKAMEELKYEPNMIARSLASNSTNILGVILPNAEDDLFVNPFFMQAMKGISVHAQKRGYYIMYVFAEDEAEELKFIKQYIRSKLVDGIILMTSRENDKCISYLKTTRQPFVLIGRPEEPRDTLWVDNDNFQAMYNVVDYLIKKGHRDIGFIGGPANLYVTRDRLDGYKKALKMHGLYEDGGSIKLVEEFSQRCGCDAMRAILRYVTPSAVVTTDDLLAFGANAAICERNIHGLDLIGFNNTYLAEYQTPSLTSVDINAEELGIYAAKLLIDKLENEDMPTTHYVIDTKIVERDSTHK